MDRMVLGLLVSGLMVVSGWSAPKPKAGPSYFAATTLGDTLVWERSRRARGLEVERIDYTVVVTKVDRKDGALVVSTTDGKEPKEDSSRCRWQVSDNGVYLVTDADGKALDPPTCLLKLPAKPGDTWTDKVVNYTVVGEEEVEVPAGKFKAIRLRGGYDNSDAVLNKWYAQGVGLVKVTWADSDAGIEIIDLLKSFKPGKE